MAVKKTSKAPAKQKTSRLLSEPAYIVGPRLLFILSVAMLCILGIVMVYSASSIAAYNEYGDAAYYIKRQLVFLVIGILVCVICARIPYSLWANPAVFITAWAISVAFLSMTAFGMGVTALGAERSIVIGGFALQPAEFAKITVLIAVASIVKMHIDGVIEGWRFVAIVLIASIVPLLLIYRQPDLGTAIFLAVGIITLALLAGIPWRIIFIVLGVVAAYVVIACLTQPYHMARVISMIDPWLDPQGDGYQAIQSLYAFGSGGIFGTGIGLSRQKYLYLPYAHTDFIYAIIGEELGLIGAVIVVLLFGLLIISGMRICRNAPDMFGCMLSGSFTVMIGFQACVNMACVTGIAPVTGKALPFISYGGSSMIASMIMVGIILSVSFRSRAGMAYERKRDSFMVIDGGKKGRSQGSQPDPSGSSSRRRRGSYGGRVARADKPVSQASVSGRQNVISIESYRNSGNGRSRTQAPEAPKGYAGLKRKQRRNGTRTYRSV